MNNSFWGVDADYAAAKRAAASSAFQFFNASIRELIIFTKILI
jgi:hypothetical protein